MLQATHEIGEIDRAKSEVLATRRNCVRNFVSLSRAQDEDNPLGRLLQRFQQSIKCFFGDLVRFVDDENFVSVSRWPVPNVFANFAHFVDTPVRRRVDLNYVNRVAGADFSAARADAARPGRRSVNAV